MTRQMQHNSNISAQADWINVTVETDLVVMSAIMCLGTSHQSFFVLLILCQSLNALVHQAIALPKSC